MQFESPANSIKENNNDNKNVRYRLIAGVQQLMQLIRTRWNQFHAIRSNWISCAPNHQLISINDESNTEIQLQLISSLSRAQLHSVVM